MAKVGENAVSLMALGMRAAEKASQLTGGRDNIFKTSTSGGAAFPKITKNSGVSESGKGGNVRVAA